MSTWIVVTPDEYIYPETFGPEENVEIRVVRFKPWVKVMPVGMASGRGVYASDPRPAAARRGQWIREPEVLAGTEQRRRGPGAIPPEDVAPVAAELGGPPLFAEGRVSSTAAAPILQNDRGAGRDARGGFTRPSGDREEVFAAGTEEGGVEALIDALEGRHHDGEARGSAGATHETGDARTLPARCDASGTPNRGFTEAVEMCSQSEIPGFLVRGPRTARWVLNFLAEQGRRCSATRASRRTRS